MWNMKRATILLLAALTVMSAWAQGQKTNPKIVGKLEDVQGLVTVSVGDQLINAFTGAALVVDTRIVTSSTGSVTLSFDNGCDIKLKPNESLKVKDGATCAALLASVGQVAVPAATAPVVPAASVAVASTGWLIGGALGISAVLINQNSRKLSGS
jgi:hypothetical protein